MEPLFSCIYTDHENEQCDMSPTWSSININTRHVSEPVDNGRRNILNFSSVDFLLLKVQGYWILWLGYHRQSLG